MKLLLKEIDCISITRPDFDPTNINTHTPECLCFSLTALIRLLRDTARIKTVYGGTLLRIELYYVLPLNVF